MRFTEQKNGVKCKFVMNTIPASIEAYLLEAGFTATEVIVIKRLLQEDALTLRQLASKTGKSTGVLDQAIKKLFHKKVVDKEWINDGWKFTLVSLDAISEWVQEDIHEKREALLRKHQDFEHFVATVKIDKYRPEMIYFEGFEGMKSAYRTLLEKGNELLQYSPTYWTAEDDPLRDFRVDYFRERRSRNVFARIIGNDTALGRRHKSRDPFEFRETLLIPQEECPFSFEKIVVGNTIACFDLKEERTCLIHYPQMAHTEHLLFEQLWKTEKAKLLQANLAPAVSTIEPPVAKIEEPPEPVPEEIPLRTRVLSAFRQFFLTRSTVTMLFGFAVFSGVITYGLHAYAENLNYKLMQDHVKSIATTASFEFDAKDLDQLHRESDWQKPQWAKVVNQLKKIRVSNDDVVYAYIFRRRQSDPSQLEFVSDSHSLNPYANTDNDPTNDIDANNDGKIEPQGPDQLQWPGQFYAAPIPPGINEAFNNPKVSTGFYADQFGKVLTGWGPIKDASGKVVAVVGIDIKASKLSEFTRKTFAPILVFLLLLVACVILQFAARNRSLAKELMKSIKIKKVIVSIIFLLLLSILGAVLSYLHALY